MGSSGYCSLCLTGSPLAAADGGAAWGRRPATVSHASPNHLISRGLKSNGDIDFYFMGDFALRNAIRLYTPSEKLQNTHRVIVLSDS
jgi:hypothetical protein